jgi:hypothetical protein
MPSKPDILGHYAKSGGPVPAIGPIGESFWAGYFGQRGVRRGISGSVPR